MSLTDQVSEAIKTAMKNKEKERLTPLRALKTAITLALTEKGNDGSLSEEKEIQLLQKLVKQRKESAAIFQEQNRTDLAEKEEAEAVVLQEFLPEQLSEDEIRSALSDIISATGARGMQDMGKVMGAARDKFAGKADNSLVARLVKEMLA